MKKIYFFSGPHPIHESLILYPPEGYIINSNVNKKIFLLNREYDVSHSFIKNIATGLLNMVNMPRVIYFFDRECDLIHTSSGVIPLNKKPWVVSTEYVTSFVGLQEDKLDSKAMKDKIVRFFESDFCKAILPFSEACRKSIENVFSNSVSSFKHKIEVIYNVVGPNSDKSINYSDNEFRILFISSHFFDDGGRELVEAFKILSKNYDIKLCMIVQVPQHHENYFKNYISPHINNPKIEIITEKISRDRLFNEFYKKSHLFVMPSYRHLFGYVILEAMSVGLPVICTDVFAMPEMVINNYNGLVIKSTLSAFDKNCLRTRDYIEIYRKKLMEGVLWSVVEQLTEGIKYIMHDPAKMEDMGRHSLDMVINGKFSISQRNEKLKQVYERAIK